jgi:hypothetical protein
MRDVWKDIKLVLRALFLLAGVLALASFFMQDTAFQETAAATLAGALFLLVIALKD